MRGAEKFLLRGEHLALLRAANICWEEMEWGAPAIDGKRPYGNGDLVESICTLVGWEGDTDSDDLRRRAFTLHQEIETALQVVLSSGSFEPGIYEAIKYGRNWHRVADLPEQVVHLPALLGQQFGISRSEARRVISQGGVKVGTKVCRELDLPADSVIGRTIAIGRGVAGPISQPQTDESPPPPIKGSEVG